ncbi:MAG: heavy metal-associated domain-containing protein [Lachnospiraceae bacterium]|nr:heavy metal-associated domain-containing protein [Lachnospiraceae bacterium]
MIATVVIVLVLVLIAVYAIKSSKSHFKGEGGCCGGGGGDSIITKADIPVKKLDGEKIGEKIVSIEGMHCDHCVFSVTRAINRIDGAAATVDLKKNRAVVAYDTEISDHLIKNAVEREGFTVTKIRTI